MRPDAWRAVDLRISAGCAMIAKLPVEATVACGNTADFPSGQRDLTVNQALRASVVRIHYPPRLGSSVVEHFLGKEEVLSSTLSYSSKVIRLNRKEN